MSLDAAFEPIEWTDKMATGVPTIDDQHRYLIELLQDANTKLPAERDSTALAELAMNLLSYAIMHFETEEELMQRYGYPAAHPQAAEAHVAQHRGFSQQVVAVRDQLREGRLVSRVAVLKFLNEWLRDHVLGIDQALGKYLFQAINESTNSANR